MSEWEQVTYREIVEAKKIRAIDRPDVHRLLSVTADEGVIDQAESGRRDISAKDKSKYLVVAGGDVVYNTMRMWQGVSGFSTLDGIVSPAYTVLQPRDGLADGRFIAHTMKLPENVNWYRRYAQGLVSDTWTLKFSVLALLPVSLPPLEEQRRIAEVLDTIDETIQATERVIAKLEATRSGLMHHLFGSHAWRPGLLTDTLGSFLLRSPKNGRSPVEAASWQGAYMLGLGCLSRTGFVPNQLKFAPPLDASLTSALLNDGDLLMSRSNTRDRVGYVGRFRDVGSKCIYPDLMMRLVPRNDVNSRYLELALQSDPGRRQIEAIASGTSGSMVKITGSGIARLSVPVMSLPEQLDVSQRIDEQDSSITRAKEVLEKTREMRAGLASDLLSGRVRTVAA